MLNCIQKLWKRLIRTEVVKNMRKDMLRSLKELESYTIKANTEEIGDVRSFLFDEKIGIVRFLVVDTGKWNEGMNLLVSPLAIEKYDWQNCWIILSLSKEVIKKSPTLEEHKPVSRKKELKAMREFQRDVFCTWHPISSHCETYPKDSVISEEEAKELGDRAGEFEPRLRDTSEVIDYNVEATDGPIGHIEDIIAEDDTWFIRYFVVDTKPWIFGRKVLVGFDWLRDINWSNKTVKLDLTREKIKNSPEYDPTAPINREWETVVYDYYGQPKYWAHKR